MSTLTLGVLFLGVLVLFLGIGFPVAYSLGVTSVVLMMLGIGRGVSPELLMSTAFNGINSFTLLAIPFFLFAGRIMNVGGMTTRIFDFCKAVVGSTKGGLGHVNILASTIFAGMSGLATADAAGLGAIEYTAMTEGGYTEEYAAGLSASSSIIGAIFPPSVPMVLYAIYANVSVGGMLMAGVFPGLLFALMLMVMVSIQSHFGALPRGDKFSWARLWETFRKGLLSLGVPLILFLGIISGFFTPTEAAAVAILYAIILTALVYKELTLKEFWQILMEVAISSTIILILLGMVNIYSFLLIQSRIPILFAEGVVAISSNPYFVFAVVNALMLVLGMFINPGAAMGIVVPILMPLILSVGIDPIHFGLVLVFTTQIGMLTPPFGMVLFVLSGATGVPLEKVISGTLKYYVALFACLIVLILFPALSTWLPSRLF